MKTGTKVNQELLPLGGNQSQQELKKWWDRRAVPVDLLKYVTNPEVIDRSKLLDVKDIDEFLKNDIDYPNRGELIIKGYERKLELLEKFQKGEKIYQKKF